VSKHPIAVDVLRAAVAGALVLSAVGCGGGEPEPPRRTLDRPPATRAVSTTLPTTTARVPFPAGTRPTTQAATATTRPTTLSATRPTPDAFAEETLDQQQAEAETLPDRPAAAAPVDDPEADGELLESLGGGVAATLLAERLALLSTSELQRPTATQAQSVAAARQAEALATMAARLAPENARLARALVAARLAVGSPEQALRALDHYRKLAPDDRLAQLRYVDLSAEALESADERLSYFERLADSERVPEEVRAHAAVRAAELFAERLEQTRADEMVAQAAELDPYNPRALELDLSRRLAAGAERPERVEAFAKLLRADVTRPDALAALADELGGAGLVDEAATFYDAAARAHAQRGVAPPTRLGVRHASALLAAARPQQANQVIARTNPPRTDTPDGIEAGNALLLLRGLIVSSPTTPAEQLQTTLDPLVQQLNGQLAAASAAEPTDVTPQAELPDPIAAAAAVEDDPAKRLAVAVTLADRAWVDLYLLRQETDPALLDAVARLAGEGSPVVPRLRGWQALRAGDEVTAREKLEPAAATDPLSKLGLLVLRREAGEDVLGEARELLTSLPPGVAGATVADAFEDLGLAVRADAADARDVRAALATFPNSLLRLLDPNETRRVYTLAARPTRVSHPVGEPMIATLTLHNASGDVLTLGPAGVIQPPVRVDATVRGLIQQQIPAAASAEWAGRTRLEPGDRVEQEIRVDGPALSNLLLQNPQLALTVFADVTSNPSTVLVPDPDASDDPEQLREAYIVGAAGQSQAFRRVMDRRGLAVDLSDPKVQQDLQQRLAMLRDGSPGERLRSARATSAQLRWLLGYAQQLRDSGAAPEEVTAWEQLAGQIASELRRAALVAPVDGVDEEEAAANAVLRFEAATVTEPTARGALLDPLLTSGRVSARVVGVLAALSLQPDAEAIAAVADADADPTVRRLARATLAVLASVETDE
jgi:hypothetical protein